MNKISVIVLVDRPDEVTAFYGWLRRNRSHIVGISENEGCGCCVDIYSLVVNEEAEVMPLASSDRIDEVSVRFGIDRDAILCVILGETDN